MYRAQHRVITALCIGVCESCLGKGSVVRDSAGCSIELQVIQGVESVIIMETAQRGCFSFIMPGCRTVQDRRFASLPELADILNDVFGWRDWRRLRD